MNIRMVAVASVALVAVVGLAVLSTWRLAAAWGPDVNGDGQVRSQDILAVSQAYGQSVPTEVPVREQNRDASGYIRVHEQGSVNVSAAAPLPVQQQGAIDVNVLSDPQPQALHVVLHETVVGDGGGFARTSFADTSGCSDFIAMSRSISPGMGLQTTTQYASPDGTTSVPVYTLGTLMPENAGLVNSSLRFGGTYPYFAVAVSGVVGGSAEVWLYCR
jgi:hypothetical protein